jgi:L-cysteine:1D-myo-inositol 2-amino-2-deoxy-alpha-D-glucopyranoside ligase
MVFIRDLVSQFSANAIRVYLLGHHYRQVWEWSLSDLSAAAGDAARLESASRAADTSPPDAGESFAHALAHDLDTPAAIEVLRQASGATLRELGAVLGLDL